MTDGTRSRCILLVDDDPDIRESLAAVLEDEGYAVASATNGREALEYLAGAAPPCLILLDLMMPVMNGWQFCSEASKDPALANIPVVVITAMPRIEPSLECANRVGIFEKPVRLERLLDTVARYC